MFEENKEDSNNPFSENDVEKNEQAEAVQEGAQEDVQEEAPTPNLEAELEDANNKYLRLLADFDNFRKRQATERENLLKYGAVETLKKIIPVLDNLERARKSIENIEDSKVIKESYEIVIKQLMDVLNKSGLEIIETKDKEFDPNLHEAVIKTPTNDYEENFIIEQLQTGYKVGDNVLRAALVNVAAAVEES